MGVLLSRLGRFCFRRRRLIVLLWMVLLAVAGMGAATLSQPTTESFSVPGTESQRANELLKERFPQAATGGATARLVFSLSTEHSLTEPARRAAVERVISQVEAGPQVGEVTDPYAEHAISGDGRIALAEVRYRVPADDLSGQDRTALRAAAVSGRGAGMRVELGGDALRPGEGAGELIGVAVAALVLGVTLGSLLAAGLPLLTAVIGIAIGLSTISAATSVVELSSDTLSLALMLGLAVAIDYALFIIFRYRHEVFEGREPLDAIARAVASAGAAVVFAGSTVIIALVGLAVVGIPILTEVGVAAAFTVAISVLIALTLLPALLGFAGRRALRRRGSIATRRGSAGGEPVPVPGEQGDLANEEAVPTAGRRWGRLVTARPVPVLLTAVLALVVVATPALDLRLGLPDDGTAPAGSTQHKAYELLAEGFGPGINGPLTLVVQAPGNTNAKEAAQRVAKTVSQLPDVTAVETAGIQPAGDTALLSVVPSSGPTTKATEVLIGAIRRQAQQIRSRGVATIAVTGQTAIDIDTSEKLAGALVPYLGVVVGLAFLLLMVVFRSIVVPLKATVGFLLSVAAAFGAVVVVFEWGWLDVLGVHASGVIVNLLPVMMIGMVFGLAMDYQVFLVTRMREEHLRGATPVDAVVTGLTHGARVVTAAAIIMISVFSGFVLSDSPVVQSFGFALAAAVFFDAFLVRMTIVPAVMTLLGRASWWLPDWLQRLLPQMDLAGEEAHHWARGEPDHSTISDWANAGSAGRAAR